MSFASAFAPVSSSVEAPGGSCSAAPDAPDAPNTPAAPAAHGSPSPSSAAMCASRW